MIFYKFENAYKMELRVSHFYTLFSLSFVVRHFTDFTPVKFLSNKMRNSNIIAFPVRALIFLCLMMSCSCGVIPSNGFPCSTFDIHVKSGLQGRNALIDPSYRWKTFRIQIGDVFDGKERRQIEGVVEKFRDILPCVQFQILPSDSTPSGDYVHVSNRNEGCYATLGRVGGKQNLNLGPGCMHDEVIIHELIHALGIHHEHMRSDRDDYVDIFWENIRPDRYSQFKKLSAEEFKDFGVPYNYQSIMHYPSEAFSINDKPTILKKDGSEIGWNTEIQDSDILKLRRMYDCSNEVLR